MANVVNKLWNMINMNTAEDVADEDYEEGTDYNEEEDQEVEEPRGLFGGRKSGRVVNMQQSVKMVITQPTTFEQAEEICDLLKEKKSVIINLEYVNKDVARRIIDVVSGAVHALEGHMQKISNSIFLIAPYNYDIATDSKEDVKSKLPVSWLKNN
ncbi:cell division protein sepF [Clostridium sp. CAG:793]|nr:cell division protein sepF [Clostridium sp. CAG:793]